jgi:hypothetical protein
MTSFPAELACYVGRIRQFTRRDWVVYVAWVAMIASLCACSSAFLWLGARLGAAFPPEAYCVPVGAGIFTFAIAVDTIGHRTVYKDAIRGGEQLVHAITIGCGVASVVLLVLAYDHPFAVVPAVVLTALSFVYSFVDEAFHWRRYVRAGADRVEMWSHVGILVGHGIMMLGWWSWQHGGYVGVAETLRGMR